MKYLQFNVIESCIGASPHITYHARIWWLAEKNILVRQKDFSAEEDAWSWLEQQIERLENRN